MRNVLIVVLVCFTACSSSVSTTPVPTGFISNYDKLRPSEDADGEYSYINRGRRPGVYTMVIVDRVQYPLEPTRPELTVGELKGLAASFEQNLRDAFGESLQLVDKPGFGVLRVRSAITDAKAPDKRFFQREQPDISSGVEGVSAEIEVLDSVSNEPVVQIMRALSHGDCGRQLLRGRSSDAGECMRELAVGVSDRVSQARGLYPSSQFPLTGSELR